MSPRGRVGQRRPSGGGEGGVDGVDRESLGGVGVVLIHVAGREPNRGDLLTTVEDLADPLGFRRAALEPLLLTDQCRVHVLLVKSPPRALPLAHVENAQQRVVTGLAQRPGVHQAVNVVPVLHAFLVATPATTPPGGAVGGTGRVPVHGESP
jgi:hypothetical protein